MVKSRRVREWLQYRGALRAHAGALPLTFIVVPIIMFQHHATPWTNVVYQVWSR